jgi:TetR/AcrR family transcriptional repressor of nem operon
MSENEVRIKLLQAARSFMLAKGYAGTTVGEICQQAGVTKGAFFHYFPSKEALGQAMLDYHWRSMRELLEINTPFLQITDPLERLKAHCRLIADLHDDPDTPTSCLFGNLTQELPFTNPVLCEFCKDVFAWWTAILQTDLEEAIQLYKPRIPINIHQVAEHFVVIYEGAMILAKAKKDRGVIRTHLEQFIQYLDLVFS